MTNLLDPVQLGDVSLQNRVVMAPLTRMRSKQPGLEPWALNATYYAQRATAGLIISEASQISQQGQGYPGTPGIYTPEQVAGWKLVTDAVHEKNGKIFLQLWHVGRVSDPIFLNGELPEAPSAIPSRRVSPSPGWPKCRMLGLSWNTSPTPWPQKSRTTLQRMLST